MLTVTSKIQDVTHYLFHGDLEISHAYQHWLEQVELNECHNHEQTEKISSLIWVAGELQTRSGQVWMGRTPARLKCYQSQLSQRLHSDSGLENSSTKALVKKWQAGASGINAITPPPPTHTQSCNLHASGKSTGTHTTWPGQTHRQLSSW